MITLKPMEKIHYPLLVEWNAGKDQAFLFQWAGPTTYHFPLTVEQVEARNEADNSRIFMIELGGEIIGTVELDRIDLALSSANVCRFLLREDVKGKGVGTAVLRQIIRYAFDTMKLQRLTLAVLCYNAGAIRCYERCGFLVKEYRAHEDPNKCSYLMECENTPLHKRGKESGRIEEKSDVSNTTSPVS